MEYIKNRYFEGWIPTKDNRGSDPTETAVASQSFQEQDLLALLIPKRYHPRNRSGDDYGNGHDGVTTSLFLESYESYRYPGYGNNIDYQGNRVGDVELF